MGFWTNGFLQKPKGQGSKLPNSSRKLVSISIFSKNWAISSHLRFSVIWYLDARHMVLNGVVELDTLVSVILFRSKPNLNHRTFWTNWYKRWSRKSSFSLLTFNDFDYVDVPLFTCFGGHAAELFKNTIYKMPGNRVAKIGNFFSISLQHSW